MNWMALSAALAVTVLASLDAVADESASPSVQLKLRLMQATQVVGITNFDGPPNKFVEDNNSETLEVVFLTKKEYGPSAVSSDGEVIFIVPDEKEDVQQGLISAAFDIRVERRLGAQKSN